ncbi:MAG TPA: hypothetical protein VHG71_04620 [Verrucomicrobiae bacterium]|nr:hypothetical protein [Verrucomicrobiae bacterium]
MKNKITRLAWKYLAVLSLALTSCFARADYLPNNFWPNSSFESGDNLDAADGSGTPTGWTRTGGDPTICQVLNSNSVSPTHSLAVVDNSFDYGEWDSTNLSLAGHANPGDSVVVQWYELYSISSGEMRVTVDFFDANTNLVGETHSVVTGDSSGWTGDISTSTFTKTNETLVIPEGATQMHVALVSGGSGGTQGIMLIDDLSVALQATPQLLSGNFWPNPSFEAGANLDSSNGTPTGWNRGGSDGSIDQITTNNYVSSSHALEVVDNDPNNYGSWYSDQISLAGLANPGDALNLQWFELYSVTNGEMRVTFSFYDSGGNDVSDISYTATGNSAGWQGVVAGSGFTRRNEQVIVPPNATKLLVQLVSAGPVSTTGIMLIDDLSIATPPMPALLTNNFWPNPTFESGQNLDQTNGVPTGWVAAGDDLSICQVTTNAYSSSTHALAVIDDNDNGYAEWDADFVLGTNAGPGDTLNIQWSELYSITNGPMRVSVLFFDAQTNQLSETDANSTGNSSGWSGQITGSTLSLRNEQVMIPHGAAILRISLVSGGSESATGVYVIDDLSVARAAYPATVLSYNFFPNPTFENGVQLDNPTVAIPTGGWQRGGTAGIDQVLTNNSVSPSHALALVDNDIANYGEWYMTINTAGYISDNDAIDIQWYQIYSVTNGNMRLSFAFLDSGGNTLAAQDFNTDSSTNSPGWTGDLASSPFQRQFQRLAVPAGTAQIRVNFASGGASTVTGVMLIDDLSIRLSLPQITGIVPQAGGYNVIWNSMASKMYSVLFSSALGTGANWSVIATNLPGTGLSTSNLDLATPGNQGFYQVIQQ